MLFLGTSSVVLLGIHGNFLLSVVVMLAYSWGIHRWLFRDGNSNVYTLLLVGLVLTLVIGTFTQFVQLKVSPGEFSVLQSFSLASFNRVQTPQLLYGALVVAAVALVGRKSLATLDVLSLGRDQAISLGGRLSTQRAPAPGPDRGPGCGIDQPAGANGLYGYFRRQ